MPPYINTAAPRRSPTPDGKSVKARALSGGSNMLFHPNSVTGAVEVIARDGQSIALNEDLHAN